MALRQQQQIDTQHQLLAAKEQRLRFLKNQEIRNATAAAEGERLRRLRERVEAQESKLRRLRALRGQVDLQKTYNVTLSKYFILFTNSFLFEATKWEIGSCRQNLCASIHWLNWNIYNNNNSLTIVRISLWQLFCWKNADIRQNEICVIFPACMNMIFQRIKNEPTQKLPLEQYYQMWSVSVDGLSTKITWNHFPWFFNFFLSLQYTQRVCIRFCGKSLTFIFRWNVSI